MPKTKIKTKKIILMIETKALEEKDNWKIIIPPIKSWKIEI